MTAPTREQVEEWALEADRLALVDWHQTRCDYGDAFRRHIAALAFAAGQSSGDGSGAELVREIEDDPGLITGEFTTTENWDRLRAALISADAAREDAERLATAHESVLRSLQKQAPRFEDTDRLDAIESQSWCVGKYETNRFYVHLGQINGKQCETTGATLREAIDRARGGK